MRLFVYASLALRVRRRRGGLSLASQSTSCALPADPELNHPFSHDDQHPQHVERLAAYWAEVMGGPPVYSETCGDESGVLRMHAGNGDMGDLGERFLDCFVRALDDAELPADPAFRAACRAYMRWAVDNVLSYSPEDAVVPHAVSMPRWGWDGLQV